MICDCLNLNTDPRRGAEVSCFFRPPEWWYAERFLWNFYLDDTKNKLPTSALIITERSWDRSDKQTHEWHCKSWNIIFLFTDKPSNCDERDWSVIEAMSYFIYGDLCVDAWIDDRNISQNSNAACLVGEEFKERRGKRGSSKRDKQLIKARRVDSVQIISALNHLFLMCSGEIQGLKEMKVLKRSPKELAGLWKEKIAACWLSGSTFW